MQLPRIKAIVDNISADITRNGKKPFRLMSIIKPAPRDEMGDPLYKDDIFNIIVPERNISLVKNLKKGDKVAVDLLLNGAQWFDSQGKPQVTHSLRLSRLEVLPKNQVITEPKI